MIELSDCYAAAQVGIGICTAAQISQSIRDNVKNFILRETKKFQDGFLLILVEAYQKLNDHLLDFDPNRDEDAYNFLINQIRLITVRRRHLSIYHDSGRMLKHLNRRFNKIVIGSGILLFLFIVIAPFFKENISSYAPVFAVICLLCFSPLISGAVLASQTFGELFFRKTKLSVHVAWNVGFRFKWLKVFNKIAVIFNKIATLLIPKNKNGNKKSDGDSK